ncbi:hypothetical protein ACJRO7_031053 [Eucalyptus globulus]|uniref:Uncharacterized protein n=1 Tax=Eucalyptus globulus TaxID=34317 RepID=A0ABD3JJ18_EUCGL
MRSTTRALQILLVPAMLSVIFVANEARPFNVMETTAPVGVDCGGFFNGLLLGAIKQAGPSPGEGHKFINLKTLRGIKDSGVSPGEGHKFTKLETLGGIKDSGPSPPGEGHKHVTGTN